MSRKEPTLSVPVVDADGNQKTDWHYYAGLPSSEFAVYKEISFTQVCRALEDMCGVEITYQEKGKGDVVIYEKEHD